METGKQGGAGDRAGDRSVSGNGAAHPPTQRRADGGNSSEERAVCL